MCVIYQLGIMGKWTDKDYITHSEWSRDFGGASSHHIQTLKKLSFYCCSLSLNTFSNPVFIKDETLPPCTISNTILHNGHIFDKDNLIKYTNEHGLTDPITNSPFVFTSDSNHSNLAIDLYFTKDSQGQYCCPITGKIFNDYSFIVALVPTGNVFSFEALDMLSLKRHSYHDLILDDIPFDKNSDILLIQSPESCTISDTKQQILTNRLHDKSSNVNIQGGMLKRIMKELSHKTSQIESESKRLGFNSNNSTLLYHNKPINYPSETVTSSLIQSEGIVAASLTSTTMTPKTKDKLVIPSTKDKNSNRNRVNK